MEERGLRLKFMPVCVYVTATPRLQELTEATTSQGLGLEPDHVWSAVF